jgi:uncharacterized protein (DUF427 family)
MSAFPPALSGVNLTAPVPRRIRAIISNETVVDTTHAIYVWEWPHFPQYYVPKADVKMDALAIGEVFTTPQGDARHLHWKGVSGEGHAAGRLMTNSPLEEISDTVRFIWNAIDRWFEEDEEVFVHPRNPYKRVDAIRSTRAVRVELGGTVLAEANGCVMVFETGLPTRYYLDPTNVRFASLVASTTRTQCPYKGITGGYWSVEHEGTRTADVAWTYTLTTAAMTPIAGLVAFLNEKVDVFIDGERQVRPLTNFS